MVFNFFLFCLTLTVPQKLKYSIFEIPKTPITKAFATKFCFFSNPKEQHTKGTDILETSTPDIILDEQIADDDDRPRKNRKLVKIQLFFKYKLY